MSQSVEPGRESSEDHTERQLAELLARYDESLRAGTAQPVEVAAHGDLPASAYAELRRAQAFLLLLQGARPGGSSTWKSGRRPAERRPRRFTPAEEEDLLELLCEEIFLRQELGQPPELEEYLQRYPQLAERLRARLEATPLAGDLLDERIPPAPRERLTLPQLPNYVIEEELGRGGMGVVYKAWQVQLKRPVALKVIRASLLADGAARARFRREAEAVARLRHPHIVQIYEVGEWQPAGGAPLPYFAFEYAEGGSLDRRLAGTPLPPLAAAELTETLARAVSFAHEQGVIHRDLKPANILIAAGGLRTADSQTAPEGSTVQSAIRKPQAAIKITDFGLAKYFAREPGESVANGPTESGVLMGTPSYMAPEQAAGRTQEVGTAVDVYALGAILYELLTGRPPFKAATPVETVLLVLAEDPVAPTRLQPKLPRDLETIALKCLQKQPSQRYASALELAEDLKRFQAGEPIQARCAGRVERIWRWCRRKPVAAALVLVSVVALLSLPAALLGALYNTRLTASLEQTRGAQRAEAEARQAIETEAQKADMFHYFHRIALASVEWREAHVARVDQLLEECPTRLRQWEWHYLRRLCRTNLLTLPHDATLYTVALSPDGKFIAAAGDGPAATIWDAEKAKPLCLLQGHTATISSIQFSPDGRRLVTASSDKTVRIWDAATGREELSLVGHANSVRSAAFSPDGRGVASTGKDGRVMVWDANTGSILHDFEGTAYQSSCLAFSPDGRTLAAGAGGYVKLWDMPAGRLIRTLTVPAQRIRALAFSPDAKRLTTTSDEGLVTVWDPVTGAVALSWKAHGSIAYSLAYSPDGQRLATGSMDSTIKIWDAATGKELGVLQGHKGRVYQVVFTPDGRRIVSASTDRSVKIWSADGNQDALVIPAHTQAHSIAWSPDGTRFASTGFPKGLVKVWEAATAKLLFSFQADTALARTVAFSPDGRWLATAGGSGLVEIRDAAGGQRVHALRGHEPHEAFVAVFSPDSRRLATGSRDETVRIWDVASGRELLCFREHRLDVQAIAFSPDARWVASAGEDNVVRIWDAGTGRVAWSLPNPVRVVRALAWSPDGQRVAAANSDGIVKVWHAATGTPVFELHGHSHGLYGLAWSPDGKRLASASSDRRVLVWDADGGLQALALGGHTNAVLGVAWSPDGNRLASAGRDGTIRIWDASPLPAGTVQPVVATTSAPPRSK